MSVSGQDCRHTSSADDVCWRTVTDAGCSTGLYVALLLELHVLVIIRIFFVVFL